ncbi:MAG: hypothetical protein GY714_17440 [Desulfobacterales bacterium]|nr:hypothetical protein [Desulfobacterales bacterium]
MPYSEKSYVTIVSAAVTCQSYLDHKKVESENPDISFQQLEKMLEIIENEHLGYHRSSFPIEIEFQSETHEENLKPIFYKIAEMLDLISIAGKTVYEDDPENLLRYILCDAPNGAMFLTLADFPEGPENVHIMHLGDIPRDIFEDEVAGLETCKNLHSLSLFSVYINETDVENIPIGELKTLRYLDLGHNEMSDIPENVFGLEKLEWLDLSKNSFNHIPEKLREMKNLRYLNLTGNSIPGNELLELKKALPECMIKGVPEIAEEPITKTPGANISDHNDDVLETAYAYMSNEVILYTASTFHSFIKHDYIERANPEISFDRLDKLMKTVEDAGVGYKNFSFPYKVNFENHNQAEELAPVFREMGQILNQIAQTGQKVFADDPEKVFEHVVCSVPVGAMYMGMDDFPVPKDTVYAMDFGDMPNDMADPDLRKLDETPNLEALVMFAIYVDETDVAEYPIEKLKNLRALDICQNELCDIPDNILGLKKLEWLDLARNNLNYIPEELKRMKSLRYLNLAGNNIDESEIRELKKALPDCIINGKKRKNLYIRYHVPFHKEQLNCKHSSSIIKHVEKHVGKIDRKFIPVKHSEHAVNILHVKPNEKNRFHTLVTSGMSSIPMNPRKGFEGAEFMELAILLHEDWPVEKDTFSDMDNYWAFEQLVINSQFPFKNDRWIWGGMTMMSGSDEDNRPIPFKTVDYTGMIIENFQSLPVGFNTLKAGWNKRIYFFVLVPVFQEEIDFKNSQKIDAEKLLEHIKESGFSDVILKNRKNTCL